MKIKTLEQIADGLDMACRMGANEDEPEGARYIQISDTLARQISESIRLNNQEEVKRSGIIWTESIPLMLIIDVMGKQVKHPCIIRIGQSSDTIPPKSMGRTEFQIEITDGKKMYKDLSNIQAVDVICSQGDLPAYGIYMGYQIVVHGLQIRQYNTTKREILEMSIDGIYYQ